MAEQRTTPIAPRSAKPPRPTTPTRRAELAGAASSALATRTDGDAAMLCPRSRYKINAIPFNCGNIKQMNQSIVALIRPKLNLSQKESQAAHLIEHILVAPKRLKTMGVSNEFYAQNIIYHGGNVNDFYMVEYFVVRSESADAMAQMLQKHQNELHLDRDDFEKIKSALIEELTENRGEFISIAEQLSIAIFQKGSPSIRNPWNDLESVIKLTYDKTLEIFKKYNTDVALLKLSFSDYVVAKLPQIGKNVLKKPDGILELTHPWQAPGSIEFTYIIPLPQKVDLLVSTIYQKSLSDYYFGFLFQELRHKLGLVYDISTIRDYDNNTLEIYFSSSEENANKITNHIEKSLERYAPYLKEHIDHIKKRLKLYLELEWSDVSSQCLEIIETVVSGGFTETDASMLKRIDNVPLQDLINFNKLILKSLESKAISVLHKYGKVLDTKIKPFDKS